MKRILCCLIAVICLIPAVSTAASLNSNTYTDVPSVMTQDSVISVEADQECIITLMQPDIQAMTLLEKIYTFVWREKNRPVRYYDEETQRKIQELVPGVDIDSLHMTEFMAQEMQGSPLETVTVQRLLDVDYQPGQLVVVVLGIKQEDGEYRWFPYRAEVPSLGMITYHIPADEYACFPGQQVIYHVLTTRVGQRGNVLVQEEEISEITVVPSKQAGDINRINRWYSTSGAAIEDTFRIFLVERTNLMEAEIRRIGEFLAEEKPAVEWFPAERQQEAALLLAQDVDAASLMIYDIVAVMAEDYEDTYGDVACEQTFPSAYDPQKSMVSFLGFPIRDAKEPPYMEWYCLRAEPNEDFTEIVYKQLVIPQMEEEPAMLVVLSEPLEEPAQ